MDSTLALQIILAILHLSQSATIDDQKYKSYEDYKVYQVNGHRDDFERLVEYLQNIDENLVYTDDRTPPQVLVSPTLEPELDNFTAANKLKTNLLVDDYSKIIASEKGALLSRRAEKGFSWDAYYDIDDINKYLYNTSKTYPEWTKVVAGGSSYERREILGLRINTPREGEDNAAEGKPAIFIESGIHAREWITPATTTYFINQLLTSKDPDIAAMRDQFDWHIFPVVNPDGYRYTFTFNRMWRKTRSKNKNLLCWGTDPNRNWDHNWMKHGASSNYCSDTYGGLSVFSEKETNSLSKYISNVDNLQAYIAFHSDAQMLLVPYSDSTEHIDNYDDLIKIGKTSLDYGYKVNGERYSGPATAAEILYKASGGSMDWVRHELKTPLVYTYELRSDGIMFHWPPSKIYQQGDEVTQMMLGLVTEANNLGYF